MIMIILVTVPSSIRMKIMDRRKKNTSKSHVIDGRVRVEGKAGYMEGERE